MKRFSILVIFLLIGFSFLSCSGDDNDFQLSDWVGNWRASDAQIITKAYQGTISKDPNKENGLIINGSLFNVESSIRINGTLSNDCSSVSFRYDGSFSIYGSGKMTKKNEIGFTYTIEDEADKNTYTSTAIKM